MKYLLFACVATCLPAQELTDRERMLFDRIENLERRLAVLEKNSGQSSRERMRRRGQFRRQTLRWMSHSRHLAISRWV